MQWLNEKDWIKSLYKKYIIYIKSYVYDSCNNTKQEQTKKKKGMLNYKIFSSLYVSGFFFFFKFVMPLLFKKCQKHIFNGFFIDKFLNGPRFNLCTLIYINPPKTFIQKFH
jgi:hypothetical protein